MRNAWSSGNPVWPALTPSHLECLTLTSELWSYQLENFTHYALPMAGLLIGSVPLLVLVLLYHRGPDLRRHQDPNPDRPVHLFIRDSPRHNHDPGNGTEEL